MIRRLLPLLMLLFALAANAQDAVVISPIISFDYGSPLFISREIGVLNRSGKSEDGTSGCQTYGLGAEWRLPSLFARNFGISGRAEFVYSTGYFNSSANDFTVSGIDRKLALEARLLWNAAPLIVEAGGWTSFRLRANVYEDSLASPQFYDVTPLNPESPATHFGIVAGLAFPIPNFPLRPEVRAHLDLTELPRSGINAWSAGLSLVYDLSRSSENMAPPDQVIPSQPSPPLFSRVRFLINGSEQKHAVSLDRVEAHVKQYAMRDSATPVVTQWVLETYHVPPIAVSCMSTPFDYGVLTISQDGKLLMDKNISAPNRNKATVDDRSSTLDATFELDEDQSWQDALSHLNSGENNRLIAELRVTHSVENQKQSDTARDTLVLPPVDTNRIGNTIHKKQFRFVLSDHYRDYPGGEEAFRLLLDRMQALLQPEARVTIVEGRGKNDTMMKKEILKRLNGMKSVALQQLDQNKEGIEDGILVIIEL